MSSRSSVSNDVVLAGGGVVVRSKDGFVEDLADLKRSGLVVAVVHRPNQDDWSFPKGKLDDGETLEECALREVLEESGIVAELGEQVSDVSYRDRKGRPKRVTYWVMRAVSGEFLENSETDELRWLRPKKAKELLSYEADRKVLDDALAYLD